MSDESRRYTAKEMLEKCLEKMGPRSPDFRLFVKRTHPDAKFPTYATDGSAGCDLYAVEDAFVVDGKTIKVRTGIALEIPFGLWADVRGRSSLALKGVQVVPGTIDSDFRGEISVMMTSNQWDALNQYHVRKGDRIAQLVINRCVYASFTEVDELSETARGTGGFGSSGR